MDQVTQQNAALVEQAAAAAESLKVQAQQLSQAVSVFKLGQAHGLGGTAGAGSQHKPAAPRAAQHVAAAAPAAAAADWQSF